MNWSKQKARSFFSEGPIGLLRVGGYGDSKNEIQLQMQFVGGYTYSSSCSTFCVTRYPVTERSKTQTADIEMREFETSSLE